MPWGKMAYYCSGNPAAANSMIFLHGTGCDSSDWEQVVARMPPETRLVMMDFRGHGNSSTPPCGFTMEDLASDVITLAGRLGLKQPVLAGHSLGGMVAMGAARNSFRAGALILVEGWTNIEKAANAFHEPRFYGKLDAASKDKIQEKRNRITALFQPEAWKQFRKSIEAFDGRELLETTALPVYEIYGGLGKIETTRRNLMIPSRPNIEIIWIENAGHYLPIERPAELADIFKRILSQRNERQAHE